MEVILVDDVFDLGKRGDVVKVADGFGRNYLIPKRLAIPATPGNLKMIEQQRLAFARQEAKYKEAALLSAQELNQLHVVLSRKAGETGVLFGSVTAKDIAELLEKQGIHLDRRKMVLHQPIKGIGNYKLEIHPHSEVTAELLLSVLVEADHPLAEVRRRGEESDRIVAELEAKIQEIERLMTPHAELEPPPKPGPETRNTAKAKPTQAVEQEPAAKGARRKGKR